MKVNWVNFRIYFMNQPDLITINKTLKQRIYPTS